MQITLSGQQLDLTDSLRNYVNEKMAKIERHFDNATSAHVVLSVEKVRHKAEANVHLAGLDVYADATEDDMYAAIDGLVDKLDRQVRKHKDKVSDKHRGEKPRDYSA